MRLALPRGRDWSLRARLVAGTVAVLLIGLLAVDVVGVVLLRHSLVGRIDAQLRDNAHKPDGFGPQPGGAPPQGGGGLPPRPGGPPPAGGQPPPGPGGPPPGGSGPLRRADLQEYLLDGDARVVETLASATPPISRPRIGPDVLSRVGGKPFTLPATDGDGSWRAIAVREGTDRVRLVVISLADADATTATLVTIDAAVTVTAIALLVAVSLGVTRMGLQPLARVQRTAERVTAADLSTRVPGASTETEAGRLARAFNTMLGRIEGAVAAQRESEERLRRFVADASHELRTPLTSIRGFAELYRRSGPVDRRAGEALGRIEEQARRMGLLVDDLLLLAQMDAQRPLDRRPVDLLELAADAAQAAHAQDPLRPIVLEGLSPGDPPEPVTVSADEHRLRQVVANLVANALRHTPAGSPLTLRVGVPAGSDGASAVPAAAVGEMEAEPAAAVEVIDFGPGVGPDAAGRMFERFWRADKARSRAHGGTGLGLAIVAAIVSGHRGRVELYTTPGQGCRFRVLLPAG